MSFSFYREGDILDVSLGKPRKAVSKETKGDIVIRVGPRLGRWASPC